MSHDPPGYYNTNHLRGEDLARANKKGLSQEERVLAYFCACSSRRLTAEEVWSVAMPDSPRHSVSRVLSNLKNRGFIVKTEDMAMGAYHTPIHYWRLAKREPSQLELLQ